MTRLHRIASLCSLTTAVLAYSAAARADGLRLDACGTATPTRTSIDVQIVEEVATTTAELTFPAGCTGTRFLFPVPESASVIGFAVEHDGEWEPAVIAGNETTTPDDVSQGPGGAAMNTNLRKWLGSNAFIINLPSEPTDRPLHVRLQYIEVLPYEFGSVQYRYPFADYVYAQGGVRESFSALVDVASVRPIAGHSSPGFSQHSTVEEQTANHLKLRFQAASITPSDFGFSYGVTQDEELYVNLLTSHERCGEDGFFMLIVEPKHDVDESAAIPKYFQFVLDTSGSMAGNKIEQARDAGVFFVDNLNPQDRFNVVAFDDVIDPLFGQPQAVTATTQSQATSFVQGLYADGLTDIDTALRTALSSPFEDSFARILVLLTDGEPTVGDRNPSQILANVKQANTHHTRIYPFGIGSDVNKSLLIALANASGGQAQFLADNADISKVLGSFYNKIDRPVLIDATVDFGGIETYMSYPEGPQDLFAGAQLLIIGKFRGAGDVQGTMTGSLMGTPQTYSWPMTFRECAQGQNSFLPRLWAKTRIDALLAQIEESGVEDPAIVEEIKSLASRYGIQTPYSGYEMGEDYGTGGTGGYPGGYAGSGASGYDSSHGYSSGGLESVGCQIRPGYAGSLPFGLGGLACLIGARLLSRPRRRRS